jgi:CheY-like chemotaxis protein
MSTRAPIGLGIGYSPRPVRTVLVVDDDDDSRDGLIELVEGLGYSASGARDGNDALDYLRREARPALMLVDLNMPRVDGMTFFRICDEHAELSTIPRVIVSGQSDAESLVEVTRSLALIKKPVDPKVLQATLAKHVPRG